MNRNKLDVNYLFLYIIIFFWFYVSADSIMLAALPRSSFDVITILFSLLFISCLLFKLVNGTINKNILNLFIFFLIIFLSSSLFNSGFSLGLIYLISIFMLVGLVVNEYGFRAIAYTFNKFMMFICIFSIFLFIISSFFEGVLSFFPTLVNSEGVKYKNLYLGAIFIERMDVRSIGIFREPGVFCAYIIIALIFELYVIKGIRYKKWIYCLALVFTYSTSGYIALLFIMVTYGLSRLNLSKQSLMQCLALIVLLPLALSNLDMNTIFGKFDASSSSYGNFIARWSSVYVNFEIIKEHPFFGVGFLNYPHFFLEKSLKLTGLALESGTQSTNSFFAQGAVFGVFSALLQLILYLSFAFKVGKGNLLISLGIFFSLIVVFSSQDMRFSYVFNLVLFLSLCKKSYKIENY